MRVALIELIPAFERETNHKVTATYGAPGTIRGGILAGAPWTYSCSRDPGSTTW